jgi:ribosomal protein S18 acetylase RimI-like enzyme
MKIIDITPENANEHSFFCIKNTREPGFHSKFDWFEKRYREGLALKIILDDTGKQAGFIEYIPAEFAWRPVEAGGYMFIHCIMVYPNKYRHSGAAAQLVESCIEDARSKKKKGVCVMTSEGPWMAGRSLFEKQGFVKVDSRGRFELYARKLVETENPKLRDWESTIHNYNGWHLIYADQCPWHEKGVSAIKDFAGESGINLKVRKIKNAAEARNIPAGFGVFALIKDGKLLEDHYISKTRFKSIVEHELN